MHGTTNLKQQFVNASSERFAIPGSVPLRGQSKEEVGHYTRGSFSSPIPPAYSGIIKGPSGMIVTGNTVFTVI